MGGAIPFSCKLAVGPTPGLFHPSYNVVGPLDGVLSLSTRAFDVFEHINVSAEIVDLLACLPYLVMRLAIINGAMPRSNVLCCRHFSHAASLEEKPGQEVAVDLHGKMLMLMMTGVFARARGEDEPVCRPAQLWRLGLIWVRG